MNVLLTGGTGFIGQHLLEELKNDAISIRVLSRKDQPAFWCTNREFETVKGDLADAASLENIFTGIDVVVNLAAELKDERYFESTHIEGVKNIISLSERHAVKKIIHLSSVGVVGMQFSRKPVLVNETFPCHPLSGYERTKLRSEELFAAWRDRKNTAVHILRPTNVFGDQHPRRALEGFFTRVRKGSNMPSASNAVVNYVYVKDVAHVIRHLLLNDGLPGLMNVGTSMSFEEFVCMAAARLGSGSRVKAVPAAFLQAGALAAKLFSPRMHIALRALMNRVEYDDSLLRKYTGYKYGIEKGIDAAATFYGL